MYSIFLILDFRAFTADLLWWSRTCKERCSITPPDLTASSGQDVAVVSSSSVIPESARASRERPKDIEDVILVKFVLLVSVHTTSVNGAQFSEAAKFQVLLCLNVLQVVVLMESRHKNVWSKHSDSQIIPHTFSRSCFKVVWFRGASSWSSSSSLFTQAKTASMSLLLTYVIVYFYRDN